ncbi:MAG: hypothetical protein M1814_002902 [Vezdaea aestivalis]|nr:MAG: hypothetical protein M1814_002902 [Vezdaea aestivalis]
MEILCSCCTNLHRVTEFLKVPLPKSGSISNFNINFETEPRFKTCATCRARLARTRLAKVYIPIIPPGGDDSSQPNGSSPVTQPAPGAPRQCGTCRKTLAAELFTGDSPRRPHYKCCEPCRLARRKARKQRRQRLGGSIDSSRMSSEYGEGSLVDEQMINVNNAHNTINASNHNVNNDYLPVPSVIKPEEKRDVLNSWPPNTIIRQYAEFVFAQHDKGYRWTPSFEETFTHVQNHADAHFPHWYRDQHSDFRAQDWTPKTKYLENMFELENQERLRSGKDRLDPFSSILPD